MFDSSSLSVRLLNGLAFGLLLLLNVAEDGSGQLIVDSGPSSTPPPPPPPVDDAALFARFIVRYSDWCSVSHLSQQPGSNGFPVARVMSFSDGTLRNSTGIPYIYTTFKDPGSRDLKADNRSSVTISLAQTSFCDVRNLDPEDPRCPQVILTGRFEFVAKDTDEWTWGLEALFTKHPVMKTWPKSHHWLVGKLNIEFIELVDNIGGSKYPTVKDYFKASPI